MYMGLGGSIFSICKRSKLTCTYKQIGIRSANAFYVQLFMHKYVFNSY